MMQSGGAASVGLWVRWVDDRSDGSNVTVAIARRPFLNLLR